jgi:hypothetical protein
MKIGLVVVQYYLDDAALGRRVAALRRVLSLHGIEFHEVRVDLAGALGASKYPFLDISGYREGLMKLDSGIPTVLLNDTLFIKHPWRNYVREIGRLTPLAAAREFPCAVGAVNKTLDLVVLDRKNPAREHLSTFLMALNVPARVLFESRCAELPGEGDRFGEAWLTRLLDDNPTLRLLMEIHFAQELSPWRWHGMQSGPSRDLVNRKKASVAFEYLLSSTLLGAGGMILPINVHTRRKLRQQVEMTLRRFLPDRFLGIRALGK